MMEIYKEPAIRPCGGSYQYCDGQCASCELYNTAYSTTSTSEVVAYKVSVDDDPIVKPSKEQYEKSKQLRSELSDWIWRSKKRQDELLDELFKERQHEKDYQGLYEAHKDLIRRYEIYEELEASKL